MDGREDSVIVIACIRDKDELSWMRNIMKDHRDLWIVVDRKTAEILNREGLLSMINSDRLIVFKDSRGEELALRIYKLARPRRVYICDRHGVLRIIADLMRVAPVEVTEY